MTLATPEKLARDATVATGARAAFAPHHIFLPLAIVFSQAFAKGIGVYWASLHTPDALASVSAPTVTRATSMRPPQR